MEFGKQNTNNEEFNDEEIGEFFNGKNNNIPKDLKIEELDETIGYINILDEDERAPHDFNKNIPRVGKYQESQLIDRNQMNKIVNFCRYQFPDFFNKKTDLIATQKGQSFSKQNQQKQQLQQSKNTNNCLNNNQKNGTYNSKQEEKESISLNSEQGQQSSEEESQERHVINQVVHTLIKIANPQEDCDNKGEDSELKEAISPTTMKSYQEIGRQGHQDTIKGQNKSHSNEKPKPINGRTNTNASNGEMNTSINPLGDKKNSKEEPVDIFLKSLPSPIPVDKNVIFQYNINEIEYSKINTKEGIQKLVKEFQYYPKTKEDSRANSSYKDGGKRCINEKIIEILRVTGKEMIKKIGKQILSGKFNLTGVSFPIRVMIPVSGLVKALNSTCLFPLYLNRACQSDDPMERLKLVISASLGHFFINLSFLKPLNPILGETCEASYPDGTKLYAEQLSHHPPISYFSVYGPEKSYQFWGNYHYESNAGLNSLTLKNTGKRCIKFKDGQLIEYNFGREKYTGSFWGTMRTECEGKVRFYDRKNNLEAKIEFDCVSGKPKDYFKGYIKRGEEKICKILGSYMGFIDFDDTRYWDVNNTVAFMPKVEKSRLLSDQAFRLDKALLERGHIIDAQKAKEDLELLQRNDAQYRKDFIKHNKKNASLKHK